MEYIRYCCDNAVVDIQSVFEIIASKIENFPAKNIEEAAYSDLCKTLCRARDTILEISDHAENCCEIKNRKHDPAAYWKVAEDVQLTRYRATNVTRLIAVRKGREGNDDVIFEIFINRKTKKATIKRDDTVLFTIGVDGLSAGRLQTAAISVLRSYLRQNDHSHKVSARIRRRRVAERKAAMENAASDKGSHE